MSSLVNLIASAVAEKDVNSDVFNENLKKIQGIIGQDDGGAAGVFFSDVSHSKWLELSIEGRVDTIANYIRYEVVQLCCDLAIPALAASAELIQKVSEANNSDLNCIRTDVVDQYTSEELEDLDSFGDFFSLVNATNGYEEDWDERKAELKPLYKEIWEEFRAGDLNFDN